MADMMDRGSKGRFERTLALARPFDLARTAAPVWWARGRWPNVDWRDGTLYWVGWEGEKLVWRSVRQAGAAELAIAGSGDSVLDGVWAARVLGVGTEMPRFAVEPLIGLAAAHEGMKAWAAGSLYEGVVSSVVGQSVSVASAAVTEGRLYGLFGEGLELNGRAFWAPPRPDQLAGADVALVRSSGVTTKRAEALIEAGRLFAEGAIVEPEGVGFERGVASAALLAISGIGPWTVRSAFLWGLGEADAHPSGDVALLRAVKRRLPHVTTLKELDAAAAAWAPYRGWAARLFWLDLLGFDDQRGPEE